MSTSQQNELIKNLSVNERRRLLRQVDQQENPKKSSSHRNSTGNLGNSSAVPFGSAPKPFTFGVGGAVRHVTPSKPKSNVLKRWNPQADIATSLDEVKESDSVDTSTGASGEVITIPKLNEEHVKLFNDQASKGSTSSKPIKKPSPAATPKQAWKAAVPASASSQSSKQKSNNIVLPNPKRNPVVRAQSAAAGKSEPLADDSDHKLLKPSAIRAQNRPQSAQNRSPQSGASVKSGQSPQHSSNKKASPVVLNSVKPVNNSYNKSHGKPNSPTRNQSTANKNNTEQKPTSPLPKPTTTNSPPPWQRGVPLNEKPAISANPPTAVVAPLREANHVNVLEKTEITSSSEKAKVRSVSSPPDNPLATGDDAAGVAYQVNAENVVLPKIDERRAKRARSTDDDKHQRPKSLSSKEAAAAAHHRRRGHDFQAHELKEWVNWCDACGSVILSLFGKCVTCTKCRMVCHGKCAHNVSLTCEADQQQLVTSSSAAQAAQQALACYNTILQETTDESTLKEYNTIQRVMTVEEVQTRIADFNLSVRGTQAMTLQEDGKTFRGFIRVTMNLLRPVSVQDASKTTKQVQRKASFYIDKGAVKALHLTSDTTAEQVVQALLHKYKITDNPMKFALFEKQFREEGHVILRKMLARERPLFLRLLWGGQHNSDQRGFILQENESRDIHWESFSIAELNMFIKILDKEEQDYVTEIRSKYKQRAEDIKSAITQKKT